jgi:hypothetical protein
MTNRKIEYWVIPPEADAEFAASMEEVLETYAQPYDPACPVLCMDEQPVQLLKETRTPIPATATHGRRVDYEYERAGTANIFMFTEPLAGWREVAVRQTKTKLDWAHEMARLLEGRYEHCEKVILVSDNLDLLRETTKQLKPEERLAAAHDNDVHSLSIDGAGYNGPVLRELEDPEGLNGNTFVPVPAESSSDLFPPEAFVEDSERGEVKCPGGQTSQSHLPGMSRWRRCCAGRAIQAVWLDATP